MQHWARFPAWRPLAKQAKKPDFHYKNYAQRENIFMRWKEYFLVPDHRVREIHGASFEGFYYICFNQVLGTVSGVYFHAKSEKSVSSFLGSVRCLDAKSEKVPTARIDACRRQGLLCGCRIPMTDVEFSVGV